MLHTHFEAFYPWFKIVFSKGMFNVSSGTCVFFKRLGLRQQQSPKKLLFWHKGQSQGHKVINFGVNQKGITSKVCMPNVKSLSVKSS